MPRALRLDPVLPRSASQHHAAAIPWTERNQGVHLLTSIGTAYHDPTQLVHALPPQTGVGC